MSVSATTFLTTPEPSTDRLERWLERWGGWLVAGFIHLALIALFSNQLVVIEKIIQPKPELSIRFSLPETPAPPPPPPKAHVPPAPALAGVVATTSDPNARESDDATRIPADSSQVKPATKKAAAAALDSLDTSKNAHAVLPPELKSQIQEELQRLKREQTSQAIAAGRIKMEVDELQAEAKGRKYILDSDGGRQGAIRTLDVSDIPEDIVQRVFARYHIEIEHNVMAARPENSFLNAAVTGNAVFRNQPVVGPQDVFHLSPTAVSMMSALESEALSKRGFDPRHTRVLEIRFGIIENDKGQWDLGVTDLKTQEVQ